MKELTKKEAFSKAAAICARTESCRSDIIRKLEKWGVDADIIKEITDRLIEEHYIDEKRYTRAYVHDKLHYNKWGRIKIRQGLRMKEIEDDNIKEILDSIDENDYRSIITDLLKARQRSVKGRNDYERKMKLLRYAAGRGFEPSVVRPLINFDDEDVDVEEDW